MLNQFNQFVRIQIRNAGDVAIGCPIDDLFNMIGVSLRYCSRPELDYGPTPVGGSGLMARDQLTGWLKRQHRLRHWHAQLNCLQRYLCLQQR